jgi:ATP-dependent Lon protease
VAILPLDNKPDLKDLPKKLKENMTIHFVDHMDQVLDIALVEDIYKYAEAKRAEKKRKAKLAKEKKEEEPQAPDQPVTH